MRNIIDQKPTEFSNGNYARFSYLKEGDIKSRTMLDIGCGYGWFELLAVDAGAKNITGLEVTDKDLDTARKNIDDRRIEFKVGSAIELPFKDNSFDTIVSWEVLEHIPKGSESQMFKEVNRVLRQNGTFYFSTPFSHPLSNLLDPAWILQFGAHRHYKRAQIKAYADASNLVLTDSVVKGGLVTLAAILNMYFSKWILRRKPLFHKRVERMVKRDLVSGADKFSNIYCTLEKGR